MLTTLSLLTHQSSGRLPEPRQPNDAVSLPKRSDARQDKIRQTFNRVSASSETEHGIDRGQMASVSQRIARAAPAYEVASRLPLGAGGALHRHPRRPQQERSGRLGQLDAGSLRTGRCLPRESGIPPEDHPDCRRIGTVYEVRLDRPLIGIATDTALGDEYFLLQTRGFFCADQPMHLLRALDGFSASILSFLPPGVVESPAHVRHALAVVRRDGATTIWLNELIFRGESLATRKIDAGESVTADDIADVRTMDLGVPIPEDAGFALTYHVGWERVYFFDFAPLSGSERSYDVPTVLGAQHTYLMHRQRSTLSDDEWALLISQGWFPFILLPQSTVNLMLGVLRQRRSVDLALDEIAGAVEARLDSPPQGMRERLEFAEQAPFVEKAIEHYRKGDFVSCVSVLYPRVEGVWRSVVQPSGRISHHRLATTVIDGGKTRLSPASPLLADRFLEYLKSWFLPDFDPANPAGLTRHTVSHGVASAHTYDRKGALLGFLILNQLRYFVPGPDRSDPVAADPQAEVGEEEARDGRTRS